MPGAWPRDGFFVAVRPGVALLAITAWPRVSGWNPGAQRRTRRKEHSAIDALAWRTRDSSRTWRSCGVNASLRHASGDAGYRVGAPSRSRHIARFSARGQFFTKRNGCWRRRRVWIGRWVPLIDGAGGASRSRWDAAAVRGEGLSIKEPASDSSHDDLLFKALLTCELSRRRTLVYLGRASARG